MVKGSRWSWHPNPHRSDLSACCWALGRELAAVPAHTWWAAESIRNSHSHRSSSKHPIWLEALKHTHAHTQIHTQGHGITATARGLERKVWQGHTTREISGILYKYNRGHEVFFRMHNLTSHAIFTVCLMYAWDSTTIHLPKCAQSEHSA